MLDVPTALLSVTAVINAALLVFVCLRGRGRPVHYAFAAFVLGLSLWSLLHVGFRLVSSDALAAALLKISYACALLIGASFYYLSIVFPDGELPGEMHGVVIGASTALLSIAVLTPGFLTGVVVHEPYGRSVVLSQRDYLVFAALFCVLFVGGQIRVWLKARAAEGPARAQLLTIAASVTAVGLIAMYTDLVLPSPFLEDFRYVWLGPVLTSIFAAAVTYGVFRYRLFGLRAALTEIVIAAWWVLLLVRTLAANSALDFLADQVLVVLSVPISALLLRALRVK